MALPGVAPVTLSVQLAAAERLHVGVEGSVTEPDPPAGLENVIVSPVTVPCAPISVAVQAEVAPTLIGVAHERDVVVFVSGLT